MACVAPDFVEEENSLPILPTRHISNVFNTLLARQSHICFRERNLVFIHEERSIFLCGSSRWLGGIPSCYRACDANFFIYSGLGWFTTETHTHRTITTCIHDHHCCLLLGDSRSVLGDSPRSYLSFLKFGFFSLAGNSCCIFRRKSTDTKLVGLSNRMGLDC